MLEVHPPPPASLLEKPTSIRLRLARISDAQYLFNLRHNQLLNEHLHAPPQTVRDQEQYLNRYLEREKSGQEYYFVIQNKQTHLDCGAVRIYDIHPASFCWGSWILDSNKPRLAALESALFVYEFGFSWLKREASHFDVRRANARTISFHERMGACKVGEDEFNLYFEIDKIKLNQKLPSFAKLTKYTPAFTPIPHHQGHIK